MKNNQKKKIDELNLQINLIIINIMEIKIGKKHKDKNKDR